jgi:hypothetical protein
MTILKNQFVINEAVRNCCGQATGICTCHDGASAMNRRKENLPPAPNPKCCSSADALCKKCWSMLPKNSPLRKYKPIPAYAGGGERTHNQETFSLKGEPTMVYNQVPDPNDTLPKPEPSVVFNYNRPNADDTPLGIPSLTKIMANDARAAAEEAKVRAAVQNVARGKAVGSFADAQGDATEILRAGRAKHGGILPDEMQDYWLPTRKFAGSDAAQKMVEYQEEVQRMNRKRMQIMTDEEKEMEMFTDILELPSMEKFISEDRRTKTACITRED